MALQINKGKIRVVGAAAPLTTSNAPPVFQVQAAGGVPVSQIPMSHPLLNGQAQAIVFATPYQVDATIGPAGAGCASVSVAVMTFYSGTTWSLLNVAAGNIPASACYNVMIISP